MGAREKFATQMQEKEKLMRESVIAEKKEELTILVENVAKDAAEQEMKLERKHKLLIEDMKKRYDERLEKKNTKIQELEMSNKSISEENHKLKLELQEKCLTIRALEKEIRSEKKRFKEQKENLREQIQKLEKAIIDQKKESDRSRASFKEEI